MKESINLAIRLFIITGVSALVLAFANKTTSPIIEQSRQAKYEESLKVAFADAESFESLDEGKLKELQAQDESILDVQIAKKGGSDEGYVYKVVGPGGYAGDIVIVLGVDSENKIVGYQVLESQETPGIGDRITKDEFVGPLMGKSLDQSIVAAKNPSADNEIQAISGATYSTGAATNAINSAQKASQLLKGNSSSNNSSEKTLSENKDSEDKKLSL
ncbi:MAG: RnfABCDGE type electron transport complex subunit G [Finegoldia sp.]|nr:RnfABCDGE type electron transport complex subunit G [Finegoldia sp.]